MEEAGTTTATTTATTTTMSYDQQQQQLFRQHLFFLHQDRHHHRHQHHQSFLDPARFPSNIDALRPLPSLLLPPSPSLQFQHQQHQTPQQARTAPPAAAPAMAAAAGGAAGIRAVEIEMAYQDAMKVCNPDTKRPFSSIEDAVHRLLPYHIVADYEADEDDRILDSDTTAQLPSCFQKEDHNILAQTADFVTTFEKQVLLFNIMSQKRAVGEFQLEERLMIEQLLLQDEKAALLEIREEIDSRGKASREAAEANMRMAMAQAMQARVEAQAYAQMVNQGAMRPAAIRSHGDELFGGHDVGQEHGGRGDVTSGSYHAV